MPRKPRKTKGLKPRAPKTEQRKTSSENRAYVAALYEAGKSFGNVSDMTNVKVPMAKTIVWHAKTKAAKNNWPLSDRQNFLDKKSPRGRKKALSQKQEEEIRDLVVEGRDHRNMQAAELRRKPSLPNVSTTTLENALYKQGLARRKPGWKFALTDDNKAQRVAILREYYPDKFIWRDVVFTDEIPAKVGAQRGWHRA